MLRELIIHIVNIILVGNIARVEVEIIPFFQLIHSKPDFFAWLVFKHPESGVLWEETILVKQPMNGIISKTIKQLLIFIDVVNCNNSKFLVIIPHNEGILIPFLSVVNSIKKGDHTNNIIFALRTSCFYQLKWVQVCCVGHIKITNIAVHIADFLCSGFRHIARVQAAQ